MHTGGLHYVCPCASAGIYLFTMHPLCIWLKAFALAADAKARGNLLFLHWGGRCEGTRQWPRHKEQKELKAKHAFPASIPLVVCQAHCGAHEKVALPRLRHFQCHVSRQGTPWGQHEPERQLQWRAQRQRQPKPCGQLQPIPHPQLWAGYRMFGNG